MNYNKLFSTLALAAFGAALTARRARLPRFTVTPLGPISPTGVNRHGHVVGNCDWHALLWSQGKLQRLPHNAEKSIASGISDEGWIIGTDYGRDEPIAALAWIEGKVHTGLSGAFGEAINQAGLAVVDNGDGEAWFWDIRRDRSWKVATLHPTALNCRNEIVGRVGLSRVQPAVVRNGKRTFLPMGNDDEGCALAINDRGEIIGWTRNSKSRSESHAILWIGDIWHDLGQWNGLTPLPRAIGNQGWIVGDATTAHGEKEAVLYIDGRFVALEECCAERKGWTRLYEATAISSDGRIAGHGIRNGELCGFRLDPIR